MKDFLSISDNELDGALNALFLDTFSKKEDELFARSIIEQEYEVAIDSQKEASLLARLAGKQGGGRNIFLWTLAVLLISALFIFFYNTKTDQEKIIVSLPEISNTDSGANKKSVQTSPVVSSSNNVKTEPSKASVNTTPFIPAVIDHPAPPKIDSAVNESAYIPKVANEKVEEKVLPYFNKDGLAFFAKVKEKMIQQVVKIDDKFYAKTEPGVTMYKSREVIVSPFVMSDFPVTNLQYKTFLADLASQGRIDDLRKCLPKQEVWKEYGCIALAKNYFENESYNNFPVVNVEQEACILFCEWLEEEANQKMSETGHLSKTKSSSGSKKKQVIVRLPYDYEWIYSADAAYSLIPDCGGYNTIYDASEGLVDKGFYKRTSQLSKRDLRNQTRMDNLSDVNRYGMTESEMISVFKEAIAYGDSKSIEAEKLLDDNVMEACSLAGHVTELIQDKDGGMTVRGCCWQNKDEYMKMMESYKKNGASPFVGFRVVILNAEKGKDKNPFW